MDVWDVTDKSGICFSLSHTNLGFVISLSHTILGFVWDDTFLTYRYDKSKICYIQIPDLVLSFFTNKKFPWHPWHPYGMFGMFGRSLICIECMLTNLDIPVLSSLRDLCMGSYDLYGMFEIFVTNPRFVSKRCWRFVIKGSLGSFIYRPQILYKNICSL